VTHDELIVYLCDTYMTGDSPDLKSAAGNNPFALISALINIINDLTDLGNDMGFKTEAVMALVKGKHQ